MERLKTNFKSSTGYSSGSLTTTRFSLNLHISNLVFCAKANLNSGNKSTSMASSSSNQNKKIRIVARIRGFKDHELAFAAGNSTSAISVRKSSHRVALSFADQTTSRKDAYEVDYCYEQNDETEMIFTREIKPHIPRVFDGEKATVIAFGARGSGKTYTIQGSRGKLGLAVLAMTDILKTAEEGGQSVAVSFYEVLQDHVYDLLDSKHPEVQVLEDQGKIMFKGLSQVPVKSMSDFRKLYYYENGLTKQTQKIALEPPRRSHKGLMIHILACDKGPNFKLVGKMNFVDLAGYENARRNSVDGTNLVESNRINKSLNALLNVIHALNANENHVPYRESKLTRVLQDSLGGTNHALVITCMNPLFCLDSIHAISLASKSCSAIKSSTTPSVKKVKPMSVCSTTKKQTSSRLPLSTKKAYSTVKGRKLFDDANQLISSKQAKNPSDNAAVKLEFPESASAVVSSSQKGEAKNPSDNAAVKLEFPESASAVVSSSQKEAKNPSDNAAVMLEFPDRASAVAPSSQEEENSIINMHSVTTLGDDASMSGGVQEIEPITLVEKVVSPDKEWNHIEVTTMVSDYSIEKENNRLIINEEQSPPLSTRLKVLSNNLKSLITSTPLSTSRPNDCESHVGFVDNMEPKTPVVTQDMNPNDRRDISNFKSPLETFSKRSSGMKQSLVQDYLQFLNTASKEDLKGIKGIGEKRATYILELREDSPEPFKSLNDLQDIGLSAKQVKTMMKKVAGELFC